MPLTDKAIRAAKPAEKQTKLYDEKGLFLLVHPNGGKWWRCKYKLYGKEKQLSMGIYPEVSLKDARLHRDELRQQITHGIDPSLQRKIAKKFIHGATDNSFEAIAREWYEKQKVKWVPAHGERIIRRLERDIFPFLGQHAINTLKAPQLLSVLQMIESRGAVETAHRALQNCSQIFRYAVATGRVERDPTYDLKGALAPTVSKHLASITDPQQLGGLLRAMDEYKGHPIIRCALKLAPLVFLRPVELRYAEWSEFDLEKCEWNIPAEKMKMRSPHLVPLSKQAVEILSEIRPLTHKSRYVFHSPRSTKRPMSDNAILAALRRMGFDKEVMSGHGFRATARTIMDEVLGIRPDFIEHQLAHAVKDPNGGAYNRTAHLQARREMMQTWSDYLDKLKSEK